MANPRCYSVQTTFACNSPQKTSFTLTSTTAVRPEWMDIYLGSFATPADNAIQWQAQRFTAPGTNTAYVPPALDPGDPACATVAGVNNSVEPTYTAVTILWRVALNQRATHRAILDPRSPLKMPALSNNGIGLGPLNASFTGVCDPCVIFNE